jgi:hypothetical protein
MTDKNELDKLESKIEAKLDENQKAKHGEFFFAKFQLSDASPLRKSPIFVISNDNDKLDVIVCKCTTKPPKSEFDVKVQLRYETYVRTNKIYTIGRDQLLFKIPHNFSDGEYENLIEKLKKALNI